MGFESPATSLLSSSPKKLFVVPKAIAIQHSPKTDRCKSPRKKSPLNRKFGEKSQNKQKDLDPFLTSPSVSINTEQFNEYIKNGLD